MSQCKNQVERGRYIWFCIRESGHEDAHRYEYEACGGWCGLALQEDVATLRAQLAAEKERADKAEALWAAEHRHAEELIRLGYAHAADAALERLEYETRADRAEAEAKRLRGLLGKLTRWIDEGADSDITAVLEDARAALSGPGKG